MAFTSGNDINLLQSTDSSTVGAGAGNDRYVVDNQLFVLGGANDTLQMDSDFMLSMDTEELDGVTYEVYDVADVNVRLLVAEDMMVSMT